MNATRQHIEVMLTDSPLGNFWMLIEGGVVTRSGFGDLPSKLQQYCVAGHPYLTAVRSYFAGKSDALNDIRYAQKGSEFYEAIWRVMSEIPYGSTLSYKQLAERAGYPAAFRAAGTACGANNLPLIVPCHRITKSDESAGNYAYGPAHKIWLLEHEKDLAKNS